MSVQTYTREKVISNFWDVRLLALAKEARVALPTHIIRMKANGTVLTADATPDLSAGEITTLDAVVADHKAATVNTYLLPQVKKYCCERIDDKTVELRQIGWEYPLSSGKFYSLTTDAESRLTGAFLHKDDIPFVTVRLPTVDNLGMFVLDTPAKVEAAHKQMCKAICGLVEGGIDLKVLINAAATPAEALAVADPR